MMFPLWFLQTIVIGGLILCSLGVVTLIVFLVIDSKEKQIW